MENPMLIVITIIIPSAGADPGFPVGGGANPSRGGGGRQHMILPNVVKNCMKLRKFWELGGVRAGAPPLNLPLVGFQISE